MADIILFAKVRSIFSAAANRVNLVSGEDLEVSLGKISKWFSDLKAVAFSGSYNDLTNKPTIPDPSTFAPLESNSTIDFTSRGLTNTWDDNSRISTEYVHNETDVAGICIEVNGTGTDSSGNPVGTPEIQTYVDVNNNGTTKSTHWHMRFDSDNLSINHEGVNKNYGIIFYLADGGNGDYIGRYTNGSTPDASLNLKYPTVKINDNVIGAAANTMTGYTKPQSTSSVSANDTLNTAIGKLERALDDKGTSNFSGAYADLSGKPTLGTAAAKNVASSGNASSSQVVMGNDTRLSDSRPASDVYSWAKASTKPTYNADEISGLGSAAYSSAFDFATNTQGQYASDFNNNYKPIFTTSGHSHASIYRGKYLGSSLLDSQKSQIHSGTFNDLYVGDYWTINGINWRIVDIDYFYGQGDTECNLHHLVIMPDTALARSYINSNATTQGGYSGSYMRTTTLKQDGTQTSSSVLGQISAVFGGYVLQHRVYLCNAVNSSSGVPSGHAWFKSYVDIPTQSQVFGHKYWNNGAADGYNVGVCSSQFAIFRYDRSAFICRNSSGRTGWALQDVCSLSMFACVDYTGANSKSTANNTIGCRPYFCLSGV